MVTWLFQWPHTHKAEGLCSDAEGMRVTTCRKDVLEELPAGSSHSVESECRSYNQYRHHMLDKVPSDERVQKIGADQLMKMSCPEAARSLALSFPWEQRFRVCYSKMDLLGIHDTYCISTVVIHLGRTICLEG